MPELVCAVCGARDGQQHDVDRHVAEAYHYEVDGRCASDGKSWPCPTIEEYGR
jgi:hypothetical protein